MPFEHCQTSLTCLAIGAAVIFGGALIHYLWKRYKKRQAAQAGAGAGLEAGRDKARQAAGVGAGRVTPSAQATPPPPYTTCVNPADREDE